LTVIITAMARQRATRSRATGWPGPRRAARAGELGDVEQRLDRPDPHDRLGDGDRQRDREHHADAGQHEHGRGQDRLEQVEGVHLVAEPEVQLEEASDGEDADKDQEGA
jgi:hypothetical protein